MLSELIPRWRLILQRATPQVKRPAIIGGSVLLALTVMAVLGIARTNAPFTLPSSIPDEMAVSFHVWGLKQKSLLMVLPLGAFLVVLARSFVGMKTFGLFTPMLIALAFLQMGPIVGPLVLVSSIGVGMAVAPQLLKLRMTRVGFLGVLISFVVAVLAAALQFFDKDIPVDAFPVVVTALCVERWWRQWEKDGPKAAAGIALSTLVLALMIQFVMVSPVAMALIDMSPLLLPCLAGFAIAMLGRYRGLRMSELIRFAPIWLGEKFNGTVASDAEDLAARQEGEQLIEAIVANRRASLHPEHAGEHTVEPTVTAAGHNGPSALPDSPSTDRPAPARDTAASRQHTRSGREQPAIAWPVLQPLFSDAAVGRYRHKPWAQGEAARAWATAPDARRDPWHQSAQRHHRQVQPALGDRSRPGQGGDQARPGRTQHLNIGHNLRHLRIWSS